MRLRGFKCDRCGKVVTGEECCLLSEAEVGEEYLKELGELELCDDCYEEFQYAMRNFIAGYMNYFGSNHVAGMDEEHILAFKEDDEGTHVEEVL